MLAGLRDWFGAGGSRDGRAEEPVVRPPRTGYARQYPPAPLTHWPTSRIDAVETLWGDGFVAPGGAAETVRLVKPLGLSSSTTLLMLGAGLGGPGMAICASLGAWVTALEADPDLLAVARARRDKLDKNHRLSVAGWDPAEPAFKPRSASHALLLEALRGHDPARLLEALAAALRPGAHVVMIELVAETPLDAADREVAAWCRLDNRLPALLREAEIAEGLKRVGFDVRVTENLSERAVQMTMAGWREAVRGMGRDERPGPAAAAALVQEAELWLLRIRLMRRHGIKLMRWHAIAGSQ